MDQNYNIDEFINAASDITMSNIRFDELDVHSLIVNDENLLDALSKQSAAIAYFGALYKKAKSFYEDLKKQYEYEYDNMYQSASNHLAKFKDSKSTQKDISAMVTSKYPEKVKEWNEKLQKARDMSDMFEVYYEGWKQKSFVLNNMTQLAMSGLLSPKGAVANTQYQPNYPQANSQDKTLELAKKMRDKLTQENQISN